MPDILISNTIETFLANDFASLSQVRHVLTEKADGTLFVVIAVDNPEPSIRRQIYQKELDLIAAFPDIEFDFNLIPAMDRAAHEIATGARVAYSRPE